MEYKEIWADIPGFGYAVSNYGNVKLIPSIIRRKRYGNTYYLNPIDTHMGYGVFLYPLDGSKKKFFRVCNLVGKMFMPGSGVIIHIDLDEKNNHLQNLWRASYKNNSRLTPQLCKAILHDREEGETISHISHKYMLSVSTIRKVLKNGEILSTP